MWEDEQGWSDYAEAPEWSGPSFEVPQWGGDYGDSSWSLPEFLSPTPAYGEDGGGEDMTRGTDAPLGARPDWAGYREGERAGATTEDWINAGMKYGEGSAGRGNDWLEAIRHRPGMMEEPGLRNASHAMFMQDMIDRPAFRSMNVPGGSPTTVPTAAGMVRPFLPFLSPIYSGAKWGAQSLDAMIPGAGNVIDKMSPVPLNNASRPSWEEIWWGLRPFWSRLGINERR